MTGCCSTWLPVILPLRDAGLNVQMLDTLWCPSLALAIYLNRRAPASRFLQMATVRADGRPGNRTVVFRGFLNDTSLLTFVSDLRSSKLADLAKSPWVEVCWYFPVTHEQFRNRRAGHRGR